MLVALVATMSVAYADTGPSTASGSSVEASAVDGVPDTKNLLVEFCWAGSPPCGSFGKWFLGPDGTFVDSDGMPGTWELGRGSFQLVYDCAGCAIYTGSTAGPRKLAGTMIDGVGNTGEWRAKMTR